MPPRTAERDELRRPGRRTASFANTVDDTFAWFARHADIRPDARRRPSSSLDVWRAGFRYSALHRRRESSIAQ
ncbi:MAG: hypothetical protein OXH52_07850 [Gammaproteobacteria bacterium]|nr:hypothetical protein [Gammaproteobacteria bacterium]